MNINLSLYVLLLVVCIAFAADPTLPPKRPPRPPRQSSGFVNPITQPILNGSKVIYIRRFSKLPLFASPTINRGPVSPRIVGMTSFGRDIFVTTSTAGALIYRIRPDGRNFLWADVQSAVKRDTGRNINCETTQHGGLRGLAIPSGFKKSGLFYVSFMEDMPANRTQYQYLTPPKPSTVADSVVVEFRYDMRRRLIIPGSYRSVLRIGMTTKDHPIKQIAFQGRRLLIGHGDGSVASLPSPGGMNNDGLGKILRIIPTRRGAMPYQIPKSNPFVGDDRYLDEIFAVGFRNPHNICYSKKHGIFVADIGRDNIEEINIVRSGENYGWGAREGTFVNLEKGGTLIGIEPLPENDAKFGYTYPVVQVGHFQPEGGQIRWGLAIAGSCPIDNTSPIAGMYLYCNFGERGELFYSWVNHMKRAKTKGPPNNLTQANVYRARKIMFDHDNDPKTPAIKVSSLVELIKADGVEKAFRVDARFGRGPRGEIYITSKATGSIYQVTNSLPTS